MKTFDLSPTTTTTLHERDAVIQATVTELMRRLASRMAQRQQCAAQLQARTAENC